MALLALVKVSMAQDVKIGIKAGVNLPRFETTAQGITTRSESTVNYQFGGFADLGFGNFSLQPGLTLSGKGGKMGGQDYTLERNLMYLEVPVNAIYNIPVGTAKIFLGAGPYAAVALSGEDKIKDNATTEAVAAQKSDVLFGNAVNEVRRSDFGVNFGGGLRLGNGVNLAANYGLGLSNLSNETDVDTKNRTLSFTVGYSF